MTHRMVGKPVAMSNGSPYNKLTMRARVRVINRQLKL